MTRKRCCKLLMGRGVSRNEANRIMRTTPGATNEDKLLATESFRHVISMLQQMSQATNDLCRAILQLAYDFAKASVSIRTIYK